jgi:DNA mismatch repair protein MutS2
MVSLPVLDLAAAPETQLDVRGRRVEEVLPDVDRYLNDAFLAGMPFVRVLHGKGTGALRQAIRDELSRHPLVASFSPAEARDGGDGVTVVRLKSS